MSKLRENSIFYKPPTREERLQDLKYFFLFWKGRKKGMIHTRAITLDDFRYIFFPKGFHEIYGYLGSVPYEGNGDVFKALYPLILAMDYKAKPKWCPRWFLRFLHVFGSDKSIVRVRNRRLHDLHKKLTKGITIYDYKTKWNNYDLRVSIAAPQDICDLEDAITIHFYNRGYRQELLNDIRAIEPDFKYEWWSIQKLQDYNDTLKPKKDEEENKTNRDSW